MGGTFKYKMPTTIGEAKEIYNNIQVSALIETPNADERFINKYNACASAHKLLACGWKFAPGREAKAAALYHETLGTPIDTKRDKWEGLDYEVLFEEGPNRALLFKGKDSGHFFYDSPPKAGHDSRILHFLNETPKSVVKNQLPYGHVVFFEKGPITEEYADIDLNDYVRFGARAIRHIRKNAPKAKMHVSGWCQGAYEAFMSAYLEQAKCASFSSSVSPFNWWASDNEKSDLTRDINPANPEHYEKIAEKRKMVENLIKDNRGVMPGAWNFWVFTSYSQKALIGDAYANLWKAAWDATGEDAKKRERGMQNLKRWVDFFPRWFAIPESMGGKNYFLKIFDDFYTKNKAFRGEYKIDGKVIDFSKFKLATRVNSGRKDNLTTRKQQEGLVEKIATHPKDIIVTRGKYGHLGGMTAEEANEQTNAYSATVTHPDFGKESFSSREHYEKIMAEKKAA